MYNRRRFFHLAGLGAASLLATRARATARTFRTKHVVLVAIGGGLRAREALGLAEGATMPNLFGAVPLIPGYGDRAAAAPRIAPEYGTAVVTPPARKVPLFTEGTLIANLRYAEGAPGHLQGQACLVSGAYNRIENRGDAHAPAPTLFELHRRHSGAPARDAWYVSLIGGFYRALLSSAHPDYGPRFGGSFLSPPRLLSALLPLVTSGKRSLQLDGGPASLPVIRDSEAEAQAARRLISFLDSKYPAYRDRVQSLPEDSVAIGQHLRSFYGDASGASYYPPSIGIGVRGGDGAVSGTGDALTTYHAEQVLLRFRPSVLFVTLLDIDTCHADFNGYLQGQIIADACIRRLWETIQATDGLRDQTTLLVLPEHGRHLFMNGQNPDSLGRSGIDHGQGDDGDRDVFLLALGPDVAKGLVLRASDVSQPGRTSGRYETIDATLTAASLLGHGDPMTAALKGQGLRPGLLIEEMLR